MYALCPDSNTESNDVNEDFEHAVIEVEHCSCSAQNLAHWLDAVSVSSFLYQVITTFRQTNSSNPTHTQTLHAQTPPPSFPRLMDRYSN